MHFRNDAAVGGGESSGGEGSTEAKKGVGVPDFWNERQRQRELQARQFGVFSKNKEPPGDARVIDCGEGEKEASRSDLPASSADVALVQVATHALEKMED